MKKVLLLLVCAASVVACTTEPIEGSTKTGQIGGFRKHICECSKCRKIN